MTRLLAFLVLALSAALPLSGQRELYDNIINKKSGTRLTVTAMASTLPATGYMAVRVSGRNGEKVPVTWTFTFTSKDKSYGNDANQLSSSFSLSCPAGEQRNIELLVPLVTSFHPDEQVDLRMELGMSPPLASSVRQMENGVSRDWPSIIMSESLYTTNSSRLDAETNRLTSASYSNVTFGGSFQPKALSSDWHAYLGYDVVILTSAEWNQVPPGARTALLRWNRLGGRLVIYGTSDSVDLASLGIPQENENSPKKTNRSWGSVEILTLPKGGTLDPKDTVSRFTAKPFNLAPKAKVQTEGFSTGSWPLQDVFGQRSFNPALFIIILIAFGVIVGPVNLFVFAKSGQRHKLFITTPIISLTASALLLVVILFQDGFGGKGHRMALIEVVPEENTAFIRQQQIARTGVLMSTAFPSANHTHISPIALEQSRWTRVTQENEGGGARYRIGEGEKNTEKLSGDWFKSRSEYGHLVTSVQSTRGRLELVSPTGQPTLSSTFDFPLEKIYYVDSSGGFWESSQTVTSGGKVKLNPMTQPAFQAMIKLKLRDLDDDSRARFKLTARRKDHFIALSKEGPFIDTLPSLRWKESQALITGPIAKR